MRISFDPSTEAVVVITVEPTIDREFVTRNRTWHSVTRPHKADVSAGDCWVAVDATHPRTEVEFYPPLQTAEVRPRP